MICFMAACLWLVSVQSKNLAPSPAEAALQTFQLCSRAAGAAHSRKSPSRAPGDVQGPGLPSRACPQLPFGPTQPAVMSACPVPSSSSSSLLSQRGAGPSSASGPGDWVILMLDSVRAISVVCAPRTTAACTESPGLRPYMLGRCLLKAKDGAGAEPNMRCEGGCEKQFSLQTHRDHMKSAGRMTLRLVGVREATQAVCSPGGDS